LSLNCETVADATVGVTELWNCCRCHSGCQCFC